MKSDFLISGIETGKLNAMVKNIMLQIKVDDPHEVVRLMNSGKLSVVFTEYNRYHDNTYVIRMTLRSLGKSGKDWVDWFEEKGIFLNEDATSILLSRYFKPSKKEIKVSILRGSMFNAWERNWVSVTKLAQKHGYKLATPEVICLLREHCTNEEFKKLDLAYIHGMHSPIKDCYYELSILSLAPVDNHKGVYTADTDPGGNWKENVNYVFIDKD